MSSVLINFNSKVLTKGSPLPNPLGPDKLRLYGMRFCPFAQRVQICLVKKSIPTEIVNIKPWNVPEWYFSKHPKGQFPVLEHHGAKEPIPESAAICEYLDDLYPKNRILPSDPYEKVQQKLLFERLNGLAPSYFATMSLVKSDEGKKEKYETLHKAIGEHESSLKAKFFSGTSTPGFVDYMIYPNLQRVYWITNIIADYPLSKTAFPGPEKYPKLTAWYKRMQELPEVRQSVPSDEHGIVYFDAYLKGSHDFYDYGL